MIWAYFKNEVHFRDFTMLQKRFKVFEDTHYTLSYLLETLKILLTLSSTLKLLLVTVMDRFL